MLFVTKLVATSKAMALRSEWRKEDQKHSVVMEGSKEDDSVKIGQPEEMSSVWNGECKAADGASC